MDLRDGWSKNQHRAKIAKVADYVGNNTPLSKELVHVYLAGP